MFYVVQTGRTPAYLCAWCRKGGQEGSGWIFSSPPDDAIPVFLFDRSQALMLDEATARKLAARYDARYYFVKRHEIEAVSPSK